MEFHELSGLLPFREEQVDAIEMRMRAIGWKPGSVVTLFEGKILDGRHRYLAAERVGIEPTYAEYTGEISPEVVANFVVLENCESRHLNNDEKYQLLHEMLDRGFWNVAPQGGRTKSSGDDFITLERIANILGLGKQTVYRWKKPELGRSHKATVVERNRVRENAMPEVVDAMERGDITTKDAASLVDLSPEDQLKALSNPASIRADTSGNDEWYTPINYIDMARKVMGGIDLDPASCEFAQKEIKAEIFYTQEDDGLEQQWRGRVWLNPPYSKGLIDKFVEKVRDEYRFGEVEQAIILTHNFTDTAWFHTLAAEATAICFTRGRIRFYNEDGVGNSPTSGHVFVYMGPNLLSFVGCFSEVGLVCVLA